MQHSKSCLANFQSLQQAKRVPQAVSRRTEPRSEWSRRGGGSLRWLRGVGSKAHAITAFHQSGALKPADPRLVADTARCRPSLAGLNSDWTQGEAGGAHSDSRLLRGLERQVPGRLVRSSVRVDHCTESPSLVLVRERSLTACGGTWRTSKRRGARQWARLVVIPRTDLDRIVAGLSLTAGGVLGVLIARVVGE